jgi:hypothetical protein
MANTPHHETAKIFEFPTPTRRWGQRAGETGGSVVTLAPRRVANANFAPVSYGAWYHEAALHEPDSDTDH